MQCEIFRMPPKAGKEKKKAKIGKKGKKGKKQPRSDINSEVGFAVMMLIEVELFMMKVGK